MASGLFQHPQEIAADGALPVRDACGFLGGISRSELYKLLASGELESARLGRRRVVYKRSLVAYLERKRLG